MLLVLFIHSIIFNKKISLSLTHTHAEGQLNAKLSCFISNYVITVTDHHFGVNNFSKLISREILRIRKAVSMSNQQEELTSLNSMNKWRDFLKQETLYFNKIETENQKEKIVKFVCNLHKIFCSLLVDPQWKDQEAKYKADKQKSTAFHSCYLFLRILGQLNQELVLLF